MGYQDKINEVKQDVQNKNFSIAQLKLENMLNEEKTKNVEDENNLYYTFNNYIEMLLFVKMHKPNKKLVNIETNISEIYYYLGFINMEEKNFDEAIKYFDNALKWNPVNVAIFFCKASIFRMLNDLEKYKAEIEKAYKYIYISSYMSRYFYELGWYYTQKKIFDIANALYTVSLSYEYTDAAYNQLNYIANQENREIRKSSKEEVETLFKNYNISTNFNGQTFQIIYDEYQSVADKGTDTELLYFLSRVLYDITLDNSFMLYVIVEDKELGIETKVPETWKMVKKESYKELGIDANTVFMFVNKENQKISFFCNGKCTKEQFPKNYESIISNMRKSGMNILAEYSIRSRAKKYKSGICRPKYIKRYY